VKEANVMMFEMKVDHRVVRTPLPNLSAIRDPLSASL
jgi:hypothetical protein